MVDGETVLDPTPRPPAPRRGRIGRAAREREVLELMAEGRSNQAISDKLVISVKTVEARGLPLGVIALRTQYQALEYEPA